LSNANNGTNTTSILWEGIPSTGSGILCLFFLIFVLSVKGSESFDDYQNQLLK
jgi:hypothetical protein